MNFSKVRLNFIFREDPEIKLAQSNLIWELLLFVSLLGQESACPEIRKFDYTVWKKEKCINGTTCIYMCIITCIYMHVFMCVCSYGLTVMYSKARLSSVETTITFDLCEGGMQLPREIEWPYLVKHDQTV